MSRYFTVWSSFGVLYLLLLVGGASECAEKTTLLKPILRSAVAQLTDCLLECSGMTYIRKLQLQDTTNIRFQDSTEGDLGEYCWSTELNCQIGETYQHAYVVLPTDTSTTSHEQLQVMAVDATLHTHAGVTTIADDCGLRYDVTEYFSTERRGPPFCVRVMTPQDALGDRALRCPAYLATLWGRNSE